MANITKRASRYQVRIRIQGHPNQELCAQV